ncbi:hypothetical protein ABBQ32_009627 [Trebouxia sp. C0010 RCD-2024]
MNEEGSDQLELLVDLQTLGTSVSVLLGEALKATDKRHCSQLCSLLKQSPHRALARFYRTVCKTAGQGDPWYLLAPDQQTQAAGRQDENEDEDEDKKPMTFGKFVMGFFYYCKNPSCLQRKSLTGMSI